MGVNVRLARTVHRTARRSFAALGSFDDVWSDGVQSARQKGRPHGRRRRRGVP